MSLAIVLLCAFQYVTPTLKTSGTLTMPYITPDEEPGFLMHFHIGKSLQ